MSASERPHGAREGIGGIEEFTVYLAVCISFAVALTSTAHAAGDPEAGKVKTRICQACHGADGNSPQNPAWARLTAADFAAPQDSGGILRRNPLWPKLAGQNANYLVRQLRLFKSGARKDPLMSSMIADLSDSDIEDIATYYSLHRAQRSSTPEDTQQSRRAQYLYRRGDTSKNIPACQGCHGPDAHGTETLPRLAGQHAIYLKKQLWAFRARRRASDVMGPIASVLDEADIDAVSGYLSTLE